MTKEYEEEPTLPADYESLLDPQEAMIRDQEYLQHSSLWGHQYMAGKWVKRSRQEWRERG